MLQSVPLQAQEKKILLESVSSSGSSQKSFNQKEVLTAFQKGVEYALTGKIVKKTVPVLFQPKRS